jgi:cytochrome b subunit of formate dehydrogenase
MADGSRWFVRFSPVEVLEHWLVLIAFSILALTGLIQRFASLKVFAWIATSVLGGFGAISTVHQAAAVFFSALSLFHAGRILTIWFVRREPGAMMPRAGDGSNLFQMIQYNLGMIEQRPQFDRYTIEEKLTYWALLVFAALMGLTGVIQWFPAVVTRLLPGDVVPLARSIHGLTAILAVAAVLTWHLYHTVLKQRNTSIFTGLMSEQAMIESHPLDYHRIITAFENLQMTSKGK